MDTPRSLAARWLRRALALGLALAPLLAAAQWRASTPEEQQRDATAFDGLDALIETQRTDVQSALVLLRGRVVFSYARDGAPDTLRDVQSVAKSALSTLVGVALQQGRIASLDQPVLALVPEWTGLNPDPRAQTLTLRHLLTMSAGFQVDDPTGTAAPLPAAAAWARPLASAPGQRFAYDNATLSLLQAVVEKVAGMPLADYAREQLVLPLGLKEPSYRRNLLSLRTEDMARLGLLFLQNGQWDGRQLLPSSYVAEATAAHNAGGPPVGLPYGYLWWIAPSQAGRPTFMASGYGGQFIWVHPPMDLVIALTSTVSPASQQRGQALALIRGRLFAAARERLAADAR